MSVKVDELFSYEIQATLKRASLTAKEIAPLIGKKPKTLSRELNPNDSRAKLSLDTAFAIMELCCDYSALDVLKVLRGHTSYKEAVLPDDAAIDYEVMHSVFELIDASRSEAHPKLEPQVSAVLKQIGSLIRLRCKDQDNDRDTVACDTDTETEVSPLAGHLGNDIGGVGLTCHLEASGVRHRKVLSVNRGNDATH